MRNRRLSILKDHADMRPLNRSFSTASFGVLTPRCNQSWTFLTGRVCLIELRTSTSSSVRPAGSNSCLRKAQIPNTEASYKPSASTSTEWRMPSKSTNDTIQAAMRRRIAFSLIFANRTVCHLWHNANHGQSFLVLFLHFRPGHLRR